MRTIGLSWPLEPSPYDLLVWGDDRAKRIQVKTGTVRTRTSHTVWISTTGTQRQPYDPEEVDQFFIIDGDLNYFLIPIHVVGGLAAIQLSAYEGYRLPKP